MFYLVDLYCKWDLDRDRDREGNERWGKWQKNMDEMKFVSKLALKKWIAKENQRIKQNVNGEKNENKTVLRIKKHNRINKWSQIQTKFK